MLRYFPRDSTATQALSISQQKGFNTLETTLRGFILSFSQGNTRLADLLAYEATLTRAHITDKIAPVAQEATLRRMEGDSRAANDRVREAIKDTKDSQVAMNLEAAMNSRLDRLLESLKYPAMNGRRNQIKDPCPETFEWIFNYSMGNVRQGDSDGDNNIEGSDKTSDNEPLSAFTDNPVSAGSERPIQDNDKWDLHMFDIWERKYHKLRVREASLKFCQWLQTPGVNPFWICGKPGSGKSTFVKFLSEHPTTLKMLNALETEEAQSFKVLSHFIWISGQPMEAKIKGVLCSLVYQLVQTDRDRSYRVSQAILNKFPRVEFKDSHSDWTARELKEVLFFVTSRSLVGPHCIFIDGLDEIDPSEEQGELLQLLSEMRSIPKLKLCVSSRLEPRLHGYLKGFPMVEIQHLTHADIWQYTSRSLRKEFQRECSTAFNMKAEYYRRLVGSICHMAEGVFLWVTLALKSLCRGLSGDDSFGELQQRLRLLPNDIRGLYRDMWSRLGEDEEIYQKDAAVYINLILARESFPRSYSGALVERADLEVLLAKNTILAEEILHSESGFAFTVEYLEEKCNTMLNHIRVRCAGLLEVVHQKAPSTAYRGNRIYSTSIRLVHRSVQDFLELDQEGKRLLSHDTSSSQDRHVRLVRACLAIVCLASKLNFACSASEQYWNPFRVLIEVNHLQQEGAITHRHSDQIVNLVESLLPGTIASSIWGHNPKTGSDPHYDTNSCQVHVDWLGLAAHSRSFEFFKEAFNRRNEGKSKSQLSPAYRAYLFIQTGLPEDGTLEEPAMYREDMFTNSWSLGGWLLEDGAPTDPDHKTLPCICGYNLRHQKCLIPRTVISTVIANLFAYHRLQPTHQTQFLQATKELLNRDGIRRSLSRQIPIIIFLSRIAPYILGIEIVLSYVSIWIHGEECYGDCILVDMPAKQVLQFILRIIYPPQQQQQNYYTALRTEVETALGRIAVDEENPGYQRLSIKIDDFSAKHSHITTTNPVYISKLEACLERATVIPEEVKEEEIRRSSSSSSSSSPGPPSSDDSSRNLLIEVPGLHDLANELKSSNERRCSGSEMIRDWMDQDVMWSVNDPRLQIPKMWVDLTENEDEAG